MSKIYGNIKIDFLWLKSRCDMVKHELRVESLKARAESLKARVEIQKCKFKSTSYEFKSTSYEFESTSYEFESTRITKSMKIQVNTLKSSSFPKIISPKLFGNSWGNSYVQFLVIISCFIFPLLHGYGFSRKLSE